MYTNKIKDQKVITILSILAITSLFILCSAQFLEVEAYSSEEPIIFMIAGPMTGPNSEFGQAFQEGVKIAVEEINQAGGVLGRKLEYIIEDDKAEPREAVVVANKTINNPKIIAVVGHFFSSCNFAAAPIYQREGLPTVIVGASHPDLPNIGDYIFQPYPNNRAQGILMMNFCREVLGKKNPAILYPADDYGVGMFESTSKRAEELGMNLVYYANYKPSGELDYTSLLTNVDNANADVLVLAGSFYTPAAQIVRQMDILGLDLPVVCSDGAYQQDFLEISGGSAEEHVYIATWFHEDQTQPEAKHFMEAYTARFNKSTNMESPFCYEGVMILAEAIERAGTTDGKALRDAIAKTHYIGPTGLTTLDEKGARDMESMKGLFIQVVDGKFKLLD